MGRKNHKSKKLYANSSRSADISSAAFVLNKQNLLMLLPIVVLGALVYSNLCQDGFSGGTGKTAGLSRFLMTLRRTVFRRRSLIYSGEIVSFNGLGRKMLSVKY